MPFRCNAQLQSLPSLLDGGQGCSLVLQRDTLLQSLLLARSPSQHPTLHVSLLWSAISLLIVRRHIPWPMCETILAPPEFLMQRDIVHAAVEAVADHCGIGSHFGTTGHFGHWNRRGVADSRGGDDVASLCVLIGACPGPPEHRRLLTGACNQRASASSSCKVVTFVPQALHLALRRRLRMLPSAVLLTARCTAQPESPSVARENRDSTPHAVAPSRDGAVLQVAERRKRSAYPELAQGSVQSLCVLGCAISGRWNASGMSIVRRLPPHSLCDMLAERAPHGEHLLCSGRRRVGRGAGTRACRPGQPASADRPKHGTSATILATGRKKNDISFDHATHLHTRDLDCDHNMRWTITGHHPTADTDGGAPGRRASQTLGLPGTQPDRGPQQLVVLGSEVGGSWNTERNA
ncbi:hypothetical protein AK812_SmicGene20099 [Symbiodinium microadriaticum]|uniref:Uncharacterized protein n=1 Tax=Symbiodinium microadriaticum TaxID=2951 RepID=A0A1Q9DQX9_SYMMI|nr:hypothetical protein AK812_SmicGene20099 [Symbiodinium microadriaticum]